MLALYLPIHAGMNVQPERFYLQALGIYPVGYSIVIGYNDGTPNPPTVASANIATTGHTPGRTYAISGSGDFDDTVGQVMIGPLDEISRLPAGVYYFDPSATPIETDCIRPMIRGVSSITLVNGADRSPKYYGDIELVAGSNFRIVANTITGQPTQIVFSAIAGEGLNDNCACEDEDTESPPIRFINGIPPLPDGNFRMVGSRCIDMQPISNGLMLSDLCSEPCCGCEELEAVTQQLSRFADGVATLQGFANRLSGEVSQMSMVVIGSKVNDTGCIEC